MQRAIGAKAKTNEVWEGEVEEKNKKIKTKKVIDKNKQEGSGGKGRVEMWRATDLKCLDQIHFHNNLKRGARFCGTFSVSPGLCI